MTVQEQERLHGGVTNPLVAVNERVVHHQREAESGSLGDEVGIQIAAAEGGVWLFNSRFQCTKIADPGRSTEVGEQPLVQFEYLGD
jgi:hypothetical protein